MLGVPTSTGTNVVQWIPTLNNTNTEAVPSTSFVAGIGPGLFTFNGSTNIWERYDIQINAWITSPSGITNNLPAATGAGAALVYDGGGYANGYVYGLRGGGTNTFWRYKLSDGTPEPGARCPLPTAPWTVGAGGALAKLGSYIYALEGNSTTGFARYDPASDTWATLAAVPATVGTGGALATDGTYIYALRGLKHPQFLPLQSNDEHLGNYGQRSLEDKWWRRVDSHWHHPVCHTWQQHEQFRHLCAECDYRDLDVD